jgi:ATP-dependent RNA helicase DDX55/SPB4
MYISADMAQEPAIEKKPKSFEALTPELSSWILDFAQSSGFARTTPVQAMAIPLLMGNKDLVVEVSANRTRINALC